MGLSRRLNFFPAAPSSVGTETFLVTQSGTRWLAAGTWSYPDLPGYVAEVTSNAMVWTQKYLLGLLVLEGLGRGGGEHNLSMTVLGQNSYPSGTKVERLNTSIHSNSA